MNESMKLLYPSEWTG